MQPMMTGFATIKAGKNKGKEIPFRIFNETPLSALQAFAKNVHFEKPLTSDPRACRGTIRETMRILLRYPPLTEREVMLERIGAGSF